MTARPQRTRMSNRYEAATSKASIQVDTDARTTDIVSCFQQLVRPVSDRAAAGLTVIDQLTS